MSLDNSTENRDLEEKGRNSKNEHNSNKGEQNENNEHIPTLEDKPLNILVLYFVFPYVPLVCFVFGFDTGTISGFINMTDFLRRFGGTKADGTLYFSNVRTGLLIGFVQCGLCHWCIILVQSR